MFPGFHEFLARASNCLAQGHTDKKPSKSSLARTWASKSFILQLINQTKKQTNNQFNKITNNLTKSCQHGLTLMSMTPDSLAHKLFCCRLMLYNSRHTRANFRSPGTFLQISNFLAEKLAQNITEQNRTEKK